MLRRIDDGLFVSAQIDLGTIAVAAAQGVTLIINNRPEGESPDQTPGPDIEAKARAAGIDYVAIPVTHAGFSQIQVEAMVKALESSEGAVLAYCRSGTRSTLLWALARASQGDHPETLFEMAANAGYDLTPIEMMLDMLHEKS